VPFDMTIRARAATGGRRAEEPGFKRQRGAAAWASGLGAEEAVARVYEKRGCVVAARRWRSPWVRST
jgi:hypothetical protein